MNLVKWFRRNNKKVMAVVVIVIMIGFIGGSALTSLLQGNRGRLRDVIAHLGDKTKIRRQDLLSARQELEILRMLRADVLLRSQDLQGVILGELLFAEQRTSAALVNRIKQTIRQQQYDISDKQINDIYRRQPPDIYWHCLQHEAQLAGISLPEADVSKLLAQIIPQLFEGGTYSQVIGSIMSQRRIPQDRILATLGKLLAVLQYAHMVCSSEDVTTQQIMHTASFEEERVNAEFVRFDSTVFAEGQDEPDAAKMAEHFEKYKKFSAGEVSDENPYGFGYKLPDRVKLEYMAVKLDDVRTIVTPPTQDEMGDYYNRNKEQSFTEQVQSDPNDPNSLTERVKSYGEVADSISEQLLKSKINAKTEMILQDATALTESNLADMNDAMIAGLDTEQFMKLAGDYEATAQKLSEKYGIKVYTGRTGLLSPLQMQMDEQLRTLVVRGYGRNPVTLVQVVFAVDELAVGELGQFDVRKPRIYENIGPVRDWMSEYDISGTIVAIVRITEARKACEPESIDQTFSTASFRFDPNQEESEEDVYSVKEEVAEDVKKLAAMDLAKAKADQFIAQAVKDGWASTVESFNKLHKQERGLDANEPDAFRLQNSRDLRRMSKATLETLATQNQGNPTGAFFLNESESNRQFVDQLYSLVPAGSDTGKDLPTVLEVKPQMSYYAIRNISVKRLWKEGYEKVKVERLYREDVVRSQSLAAVHFNPENIIKRLDLKWAGADEEPADANTPAESEAAS
ncbi:MAG: hypothetical protein AMJ65_06440 [Phycisphaerae bacterium SG8_4]|nr:MAG: hypothetical protein AMJ65_06440 [Phycisphaerae bacterium SG8_4]